MCISTNWDYWTWYKSRSLNWGWHACIQGCNWGDTGNVHRSEECLWCGGGCGIGAGRSECGECIFEIFSCLYHYTNIHTCVMPGIHIACDIKLTCIKIWGLIHDSLLTRQRLYKLNISSILPSLSVIP